MLETASNLIAKYRLSFEPNWFRTAEAAAQRIDEVMRHQSAFSICFPVRTGTGLDGALACAPPILLVTLADTADLEWIEQPFDLRQPGTSIDPVVTPEGIFVMDLHKDGLEIGLLSKLGKEPGQQMADWLSQNYGN